VPVAANAGEKKTMGYPERFAQAGPRLDDESAAQSTLGELYGRYNDLLVQYLRRQARCRDTAEDLAQQLWLKLLDWTRRGRFVPSDESGLRAFLYTAARNLYLDECVRKHAVSRTVRQPHAELERELAERGTSNPQPDELLALLQVRTLVDAALAALPGCQRDVVRLWMDDASIEGMVAATRAPRDTVLSRKKYGLKKLRGALEAFA
jgi:RNA polymerase sigma factor (sigma-70 family)